MENLSVIVAKVVYAEKVEKSNQMPACLSLVLRDGEGKLWTVNHVDHRLFALDAFVADLERRLDRRLANLAGWIVRLAVDRSTNQVFFIGDLMRPNWLCAINDLSGARKQEMGSLLNKLEKRDGDGVMKAFGDDFVVVRVKGHLTRECSLCIRIEAKGFADNVDLSWSFDTPHRVQFFPDTLKFLLEATEVSSWEDLNGRFVRLRRSHEGNSLSIAPLMGGHFQGWDWLKWSNAKAEVPARGMIKG